MRKIRCVFLSILLALGGCKEPVAPDPEPADVLSLSQTEVSLTQTAAETEINVDSNCRWTVSCSAGWLTIQPSLPFYQGSVILTLTATTNDDIEPRSASLDFTYSGGTIKCAIRQDAFVPSLDISETDLSFGYRTAEKSIQIVGNCPWEARAEDSWVAIRPVTGLVGSFDMTVNAATNSSLTARSTRIRFWNDRYRLEKFVRVSQAGKPDTEDKDYVDEYGINHGTGITLRGLTWAAVNCGFEETAYPLGKMYQWGRKHGLGYQSETEKDATAPTLAPLWEGKNGEEEPSYFYRPANNSHFGYDWIKAGDDAFWNLGTEEYPVKNVDYDPCPDGWRIPTAFEFQSLIDYVKWGWGVSNLIFEDGESLALSAGGRLNASDGLALDRGFDGYYWTVSTPVPGTSAYLHFSADGCSVNQQGSRAGGCLVRCIRE